MQSIPVEVCRYSNGLGGIEIIKKVKHGHLEHILSSLALALSAPSLPLNLHKVVFDLEKRFFKAF